MISRLRALLSFPRVGFGFWFSVNADSRAGVYSSASYEGDPLP